MRPESPKLLEDIRDSASFVASKKLNDTLHFFGCLFSPKQHKPSNDLSDSSARLMAIGDSSVFVSCSV